MGCFGIFTGSAWGYCDLKYDMYKGLSVTRAKNRVATSLFRRGLPPTTRWLGGKTGPSMGWRTRRPPEARCGLGKSPPSASPPPNPYSGPCAKQGGLEGAKSGYVTGLFEWNHNPPDVRPILPFFRGPSNRRIQVHATNVVVNTPGWPPGLAMSLRNGARTVRRKAGETIPSNTADAVEAADLGCGNASISISITSLQPALT